MTNSSFVLLNTSSPEYLRPLIRPYTPLVPCLAILQALVLVLSVVGNSLVFVVFHKKQYLLTPSNRLILNLAVVNFSMTVLVLPASLVSVIADGWLFGDPWCQIIGLLTSMFLSACIFTLVLISLDRYCAVVTPLHYSARVTQARTHWAVAGVWAGSVVVSVPPLFGWSHFTYQWEKYSCTVNWKTAVDSDKIYALFLTIICFCAPFVLMLWVYITIIRAAKQNHQRTRRRSSIPTDAHAVDLRTALNGSSAGAHNGRASAVSRRSSVVSLASSIGQVFRKDEWKATKTSLIIVSTFTFCWMPFFIVITLESTLNDPHRIPRTLESVAILMTFLSCAINPVVYVFRNTAIRYEMSKILSWHSVRVANDGDSRSTGASVNGVSNGVCNGHNSLRFTRRSMSLPLTPSNVTLAGNNGTGSETVLPDFDTSLESLNSKDFAGIISYAEHMKNRRTSSNSSTSNNRVTFKNSSMSHCNSPHDDRIQLPGETSRD